ncbi:unnamed protein product [Peniophora sp. CBMAI 1063]|nr:unnamed protein product [Peniophora sp. CBMAI 1063]
MTTATTIVLGSISVIFGILAFVFITARCALTRGIRHTRFAPTAVDRESTFIQYNEDQFADSPPRHLRAPGYDPSRPFVGRLSTYTPPHSFASLKLVPEQPIVITLEGDEGPAGGVKLVLTPPTPSKPFPA